MKSEVSTAWKGDMEFAAQVSGHELVIDASREDGGHDKGPRPKALLLAGLTGCTGMDVVSILRKMKEPVTWFEMKASAEVSEQHPKKYTSITLIYQFKKSDGLNPDNVTKACTLSQEKYCGVSAILKDSAPLDWRIEYI
ncbi:MAG: OsmC family protein [Spirochaetaceae bacterium]|nr:OsmC family protein [Spirochaetaceae bacterium]